MRVLLDWLRPLLRYPVAQAGSDARAYHARRYAQERALQRRARTPAARQAHRELAIAHQQAMHAAGRMAAEAAGTTVEPVR